MLFVKEMFYLRKMAKKRMPYSCLIKVFQSPHTMYIFFVLIVTFFPCICKLTDERSRNCILPLNKTRSEIKTDEDKTMNINNNPIVQPQQEAPNVQICHLLK